MAEERQHGWWRVIAGGAVDSSLLRYSWVAAADAAGLDDDGMEALVASVLRDFRDRRGGAADRRGAARGEAEGVA
jgi:hypothetical protein